MNNLISMIREAEGFLALQPADTSSILKAEDMLGTHFADDYKEYLLAFGAATFDGKELTGICNSERLSVVSATERARRLYPHFPKTSYVIEDLSFDHIYIVQDSSGVICSYGPADTSERIADSLQSYLFPDNDRQDT